MSKKLEIKSYSYPDIDSLILKIKDLIKPNQLIFNKRLKWIKSLEISKDFTKFKSGEN